MLEYKKISEVDSGKLLKFFSEIVENEDDLFSKSVYGNIQVPFLCLFYLIHSYPKFLKSITKFNLTKN